VPPRRPAACDDLKRGPRDAHDDQAACDDRKGARGAHNPTLAMTGRQACEVPTTKAGPRCHSRGGPSRPGGLSWWPVETWGTLVVAWNSWWPVEAWGTLVVGRGARRGLGDSRGGLCRGLGDSRGGPSRPGGLSRGGPSRPETHDRRDHMFAGFFPPFSMMCSCLYSTQSGPDRCILTSPASLVDKEGEECWVQKVLAKEIWTKRETGNGKSFLGILRLQHERPECQGDMITLPLVSFSSLDPKT
jgi:hypothetical protein